MSKKSILEQALLQVETLEEVMKANAKSILSSTMKKEIKEMLKKEDEEDEDEEDEDEEEVVKPKSKEKEDESEEEESYEEEESEEEESEEEESEEEESYDEMPNFMDDEEDEDEEDDETLDLTNASDEEVIKVYKSLKPEDGVIVKKSGDDIKMKTDDDEYLIRLNDEDDENEMEFDENEMESDYMNEMDSDEMNYDEMKEGSPFDIPDDYKFDGADDFAGSDDEEDDEDSYEIDLGDDEEDDEDEEVKEMSYEKEFKESARTQGFGYHSGIKSKNIFKSGNKRAEMNEQITKLKKQNGEYKKALVLFKEKLDEVAVFNASLAYSTKLITENTTTKQEKINILKRFDNVDNITEAKKLYETIKGELKIKKPIVENVANKISNSPTTSTSKEVLTESKAYENPAFKRIKELMNKIN
jgi:hypothetical protein